MHDRAIVCARARPRACGCLRSDATMHTGTHAPTVAHVHVCDAMRCEGDACTYATCTWADASVGAGTLGYAHAGIRSCTLAHDRPPLRARASTRSRARAHTRTACACMSGLRSHVRRACACPGARGCPRGQGGARGPVRVIAGSGVQGPTQAYVRAYAIACAGACRRTRWHTIVCSRMCSCVPVGMCWRMRWHGRTRSRWHTQVQAYTHEHIRSQGSALARAHTDTRQHTRTHTVAWDHGPALAPGVHTTHAQGHSRERVRTFACTRARTPVRIMHAPARSHTRADGARSVLA